MVLLTITLKNFFGVDLVARTSFFVLDVLGGGGPLAAFGPRRLV
jgi:hypothetical protein